MTNGVLKQLIFLTTHDDDLLLTGESKTVRELQDFLDKEFGKLTVEKEQFTHLGCEIVRAADGHVR
eukprot:11421756-Heterocapsa_arctica.AAC.1